MSLPVDAVSGILDPRVRAYLEALGGEEEPLVGRLEAYGQARGFPLVGRASGRWLALLTATIGGRRVFEFGSGYGFSAYYFASAVGEGGSVIGSERDAHELEAHRVLYADHPFRARIELRLGGALEVFAATEGAFDVVFLDLDKESYRAALEAAVPRLRAGGLLLADNVLWGGRTASEPAEGDRSTAALRAFNAAAFADPRLECAILPVGDGLLVGRRRA